MQVERVTNMKRQRTVKLLSMLGVLAAVMTSCAKGQWVITPGHPQVRVLVSSGCPTALDDAQDIVSTYAGDELVPPNPIGGLICRYWSTIPQSDGPRAPGSLYSAVVLSHAVAVHLATVIEAISTATPQGTVSCPADLASASIIAFAYSGRADVDLWLSDSGCQTLDNGRIGAFEVGNPSFYNAFLTLMSELAPQQTPYPDASPSPH
jgi:hypothetical protein